MTGRARQVKVGILMGSDSDLEVMSEAEKRLHYVGIAYETRILSAHRTPLQTQKYAESAAERGIDVIIAAAGAAAHLAGVVAAHTTLPVIGVPIASSDLKGFDALLSTVQMPPGVPVATVSIGKPGATNAAVLAAQIIATGDARVARKLDEYKKSLAAKVEAAAEKLKL